jgi:thiaminase/transcriptional activator TenA
MEKRRPFADQLREECDVQWREDLYNHPFVVELSKGKLPRKKYENYIEQNHYYLTEYARCIAIAATRAKDFETMQTLMKLAATALDSELTNFDAFAMAFGVEQSRLKNVRPLPENLGYTSFLYRVCSTGSSAEAAAVICPCAWSYIKIGKKMAPALVNYYGMSKGDASFYATYSSPEYAKLIRLIRNIISEGAKKATNEELERIRNNFVVAGRFEKLFWDMSYKDHPDRR